MLPALLIAMSVLLAPRAASAQVVDPFDISIYGSAPGGGTLTTNYDFASPTVVSESLCAGGLCLYSSTNPGFITRTDSGGVLVPLQVGTEVALEIVDIDDGVSVKVDASVLDAAGESAPLGVAPSLHNHPEWQVTRPEAERGEYRVWFRLVQASGSAVYEASPTYSLRLTNGGVAPTPTPAPGPTSTPAPTPELPADLVRSAPRARGDQLVYYYDARAGFTTFLNLANEGDQNLEVTLLFYGPEVDAAFESVITLDARTTRTIDVGRLREAGLPAQAGVVLATARGPGAAAVTSGALAGSFTIANLRTESAWGGPAPARMARSIATPTTLPPGGTTIDGSLVVLEQIRPADLDLAVYYDPDSLQPAADGGNQLIFVSFVDLPGGAGAAASAGSVWDVAATRNDGTPLASVRHETSGVEVSDLAAVAGSAVNGAAGSMRFTAATPGANCLIFFTESLGTFATGYLLPALDGAGTLASELRTPAARGDQLLLHYDARDGYTTFLNVANQGADELSIRIAFHGPTLVEPLTLERNLPAGATRTIDVGGLRSEGLRGDPGFALVTAALGGEAVTSRALAGSFTVANLATRSAWGAPAAARSARTSAGSAPALGSIIDGSAVALQAFAPPRADLAVFYDPLTLAPAALGGNQVVLISFDDGADVSSATTTWRVTSTRNDGTPISEVEHAFSGVAVRDLAALAGEGVNGAAGRMLLEPGPGSARNRLAYFVESLGTFATGYLLPSDIGD